MAQDRDNIILGLGAIELLFAAGVIWYLIMQSQQPCGCHQGTSVANGTNPNPGGTTGNLNAPGGVVMNPTNPGYSKSVAERSGLFSGNYQNGTQITYDNTTNQASTVGAPKRYNRLGYGYLM